MLRSRVLSALVAAFLLLAAPAQAVGTLVITYSASSYAVRKVTLAWTSDGAGAVNANLTAQLAGEIARATFIPGSGGTQPTDLYDLVLLDGDGVDVLGGAGANLSNVNKTQSVVAGRAIDSTLELQITNAGAAKTGTLVLYLR